MVCVDPTLYRPPFGSTNNNIRAVLNQMGMRGVLWNLDTNDWQYAATQATRMYGSRSVLFVCLFVLLLHSFTLRK